MNDGELARRIAERDAADGHYNAALTAVDHALPDLPEPGSTRAADHFTPPTVRESASILSSPRPTPAGWRGRLARFVWRIVAPLFERQQAFNLDVAESLERAHAGTRDAVRDMAEELAALRRHFEPSVAFDSRLIQYLQQITPFVDTRIRVVEQSLEELRMAAAAAQRSAVAARRELERLGGPHAEAAMPAAPADPAPLRRAGGAAYVGFEDLFRGTSDDITARQRDYADRFAGASDVLDLGCGRGEFLTLLRDRGISARGIDANPEMAEVCRARGLDVRHGDALTFLLSLPDDSLGGLVALQVVEHLEPDYLVRLIETAHAKLRPRSLIVLETINAACWVAFFESYIRDITHVRPLHPDTLKFLVVAAGFERVDVHFRAPIAETGRLQQVATVDLTGPSAELARVINGNVERLNERLFTYLDYAVIGSKAQ
jgi:O-antigen chain-terminating methyltransferase